jgi:hypothetical protein
VAGGLSSEYADGVRLVELLPPRFIAEPTAERLALGASREESALGSRALQAWPSKKRELLHRGDYTILVRLHPWH